MPISKWRCPNCLLPQPLDHFATSRCGDIIHPDYAAAVLADDGEKERRAGVCGVTDGLGCPRRKIIGEREQLTVNPLDYNAMLTGTAWNEKMDAHSGSPDNCQVTVAGDIGGVPVVGHIDRVRYEPLTIEDWKHTNDFSFKYAKNGELRAEHVLQVSIYAELYRQMFDLTPTRAMIWHHATGGLLPKIVELWPLEQCLTFKPYGGQYAYMDLLLQVSGGLAGDWRNLPLAGESQTFGSKSACDYCSVRDVCWTQARGAPF